MDFAWDNINIVVSKCKILEGMIQMHALDQALSSELYGVFLQVEFYVQLTFG